MPDEKTYTRLKTRWHNVLKIRNDAPNSPSWAEREEQEAWDAWVDWVEDNNLNYTHYDPRGPEDKQVSVMEWVK